MTHSPDTFDPYLKGGRKIQRNWYFWKISTKLTKWSSFEAILSLIIDILRSAATCWYSWGSSIVLVKPMSRSIDSATHHFSLDRVPCHDVVLLLVNLFLDTHFNLKLQLTLFCRFIDFCSWVLRMSRKSFLNVMAAIPTAISTMKIIPKRKANWKNN